MGKLQISNLKSQIESWGVVFLGLVLAIVGYFGPWIPHRTAALAVTGSELSWFAKPFAQVTRELFALPPIAAAVLLNLAAQRFVTRPLARLGAVVLSLLVILASTPVYDSIFTPEYRGQLVLMAVGGGLVGLTLFAPRLPRSVWDGLIVLLALVGILPALLQFAAFHPRVAALYDDALGLGWGLIACAAGFALILVRGVLVVITPTS
ncbi:MAG: hypothetical protein JW918_18850 [Anaerolineae bacterium]|nr:hypothetical protein [Anaerolineae bacterium]